MAKVTLTDTTSGYQSADTINSNNDKIEVAIENTLSRDGTGPNEMEANLDMNSNRILNTPDAISASEPATKGQLDAVVAGLTQNLDDLVDVDTTGVSDGEVILYDSGTNTWLPGAAGAEALNDLSDVTVPTPSNGDLLQYNSGSGQWENVTTEAADPWTWVKLASDFNVSGSTILPSSLSFTPAANEVYIVDIFLMLSSDDVTIGAQPGITWPVAGVSNQTSAGYLHVANSSTNTQERNWADITSTIVSQVTSMPNVNEATPGHGRFVFTTDGSISGDFIVTMRAETVLGNVTMRANSWLRYRTLP